MRSRLRSQLLGIQKNEEDVVQKAGQVQKNWSSNTTDDIKKHSLRNSLVKAKNKTINISNIKIADPQGS